MNKIKRKEGSIIIGLMFLILVVIIMFVFAYEVAILLIIKDKSDNIVKNMSSSLILNIDKEKVRQGIVDIDRVEGESIVKKIKEESYPELSMFKDPLVNINYNNNGPNEVEVVVAIELPLKNDLIFFKNINIKSRSQHRAYSDIELSELEIEALEEMSWEEIWNLLVFEEVF